MARHSRLWTLPRCAGTARPPVPACPDRRLHGLAGVSVGRGPVPGPITSSRIMRGTPCLGRRFAGARGRGQYVMRLPCYCPRSRRPSGVPNTIVRRHTSRTVDRHGGGRPSGRRCRGAARVGMSRALSSRTRWSTPLSAERSRPVHSVTAPAPVRLQADQTGAEARASAAEVAHVGRGPRCRGRIPLRSRSTWSACRRPPGWPGSLAPRPCGRHRRQ